MTTKMECSDRGYPPNSPGEFDSQSAGTPSSKEEEEKGDYAREIAILRGQFVDLQSSVLGRLDDADSLKDKFERLHQAYRTASTDTGERLTGMEYDIKKSKTERASESTLLKQVQRENEEMRQQLANQKAKMDEAARRHAEELSSGLKQLKDELLSSMEEQIDGQNLKRKQLKAYWEAELTTRCGSVKDSLSADLDKRTNFLQENYRQEIRDSAQRVVTQQAQDQRTNEATFKKFNEVLQGLQQHDYQQNSSLQTLQNRAQALETSLKSLDQDMNSIDAKHGKLHQDRVAAEGQIRAEQLVQRQVAEATKAALETMKRETSSLVDKHKKEREEAVAQAEVTLRQELLAAEARSEAKLQQDYTSLEGKIDQKVQGLAGHVGREFNNVKRSFEEELGKRDQSIQAIQVALEARKQDLETLKGSIKDKLERRDQRFQDQKKTLDAFTELANSMLEEQGKSINALSEQAKDLAWTCGDLATAQKQQWEQTQVLVRSTEDFIVKQELPRIANQLEGYISGLRQGLVATEQKLSNDMNTLRTSTTETLESTKAELTSKVEKAVQDQQQHFTKLSEAVSKSQEGLKKSVEKFHSEQLRREENFTSSVRSWQTERERIQAEELKTMKAQIKEDTESMRQENRNFQHKIWRENEASNKKLKEQFEQEQTLLRTSDELSKQELLSMKQSVKDATAAMTQSVEDTNKAMTKSVEDMNKEMKESFEELQEEAYQTVQGRLEEVEQGIKEKEKELDIRGARLEEAFEDRTEKTEQQLNQSLQEQKQRFDELERNNQAKFQAHDKQLEGIEEELRQNFFPRLTDLERDKDSMQEDVEDLKKSISGATEGEKTGNSGAPGSDASAMCKSLETAIDDLRQDLNETKASTKELEKQLQGWADDVGSLKKEHPNLLKDVEELKKTLKKGERQQQRQQPATSTASSSASAANNFSSSSASTATSFSYANANAPSASAAAARPSEGGTGIPTSSPFAVDYIFSNPEAEQRAKKLLTELRDSRRRVNDQDRRRNLLKKAFLQVHPDHTGTEDPQIRRELRIWWEKWLEENKEWYIGDRTGSP